MCNNVFTYIEELFHLLTFLASCNLTYSPRFYIYLHYIYDFLFFLCYYYITIELLLLSLKHI